MNYCRYSCVTTLHLNVKEIKHVINVPWHMTMAKKYLVQEKKTDIKAK